MALDLLNFLELDHPVQPEWVSDCIKRLCQKLMMDRPRSGWPGALSAFRAEIEERISLGDAGSQTAASLFFVADAIEGAHEASSGSIPFNVASFAMQLSLSEVEWQEFLAALAQESAGSPSNVPAEPVLRLAGFPNAIFSHLAKRGERETVRKIYLRIRERFEPMCRATLKEPRTVGEWKLALAVFGAHLGERWRVPLTLRAEGTTGGGQIVISTDGWGGMFIPPPTVEHPALAWLFTEAEIKMLHRKEAYAAECFAHLYASIFGGYVDEARQTELQAEFLHLSAESRLDAKQKLILMKSRFEAAPWLQ